MYWVTGFLGVLMIIAPFIFGYETNIAALWASIVTGSLVAIASYLEGVEKDRDNWEYWTAEILGIFAIASPFLFGFTNHTGAMWSSISIGFLISFIAASRLWIGKSSKSI